MRGIFQTLVDCRVEVNDLNDLRSSIAEATAVLNLSCFAHLALLRRITDIITVADVRVEGILRRAEWQGLCRLGRSRTFGNTQAVAGYLEISSASLTRVLSAGDYNLPCSGNRQ